MDIKEMTREEFREVLEKSNYGQNVDSEFTCPSDLDLYDCCDCDTCKDCWMDAIKNVKFKDELPTQNPKVEKHSEICERLNMLYKNKNHDYGDSFGETFKKLGVISAITRITDKVNRLQSLATKEQFVIDESIKDTLKDLANYSIMTLIELEEKE